MKLFSKIGVLFVAMVAIFTACEKVPDLPFYAPISPTGGATLSSSAATWAPAPADSNNVGLRFNWTKPAYSVDSATIKYVIEIDSTGKNFVRPMSRTISGALTTSYTNKELNNMFLNHFGFMINRTYSIDVRITSSHANNNEPLRSNVVTIRVTPYKVPPKVALPTSSRLFLVGGASDFGWANAPAVNPAEEFARLDETTWAGVFNLNGGEYLILPVKGDWGNKFSIANTGAASQRTGGPFGFNLNDNFPAPTAPGRYLITLDFQQGTYTVVPYTGPQLPTNLFLVGGATPAGWANPASGPTVQQLQRLNSSVWEITINFSAAGEFLILPVAGDWSNKYAVADKNLAGLSGGGAFGFNLNDNFPGPATAGSYKLTVNFATGRFTNVRQ
jgi:starch-binding outer membrane protein SusE/F